MSGLMTGNARICRKLQLQEYLEKAGIYANNNSSKAEGVNYLYVIFNPDNNLFKIGITCNLKKRLKQLRSQSGCNLTIVQSFASNTEIDPCVTFVEKKLHEYYKNKRVSGEWFKLSFRDNVEISSLPLEEGNYRIYETYKNIKFNK